jgi:hypothetical protein
MPWRHLIFPVDGGTYIHPQLVIPPTAPTLPATFLGTTGNTPASPTCAKYIPLIPLQRLVDMFARLACAERRIAREARLDALLSNDLEPASSTSTSSSQAAPEAEHNEDQNEEVLDEKIIHLSITRLSRIFQSDELNDILAAAAAPLRRR